MSFVVRATHTLALDGQTHWIWYAPSARAFIVGDQHNSWRVPEGGETPEPIASGADVRTHTLTVPLPDALLDERLAHGWCGFGLPARASLDRAARAGGALSGDLLRHLIFGPDYGQLVTHPALPMSRALALRSGSMRLVALDADGTREIADVRTRGKAVLAYAAHPSEPLVVYGDNAGDTFMHRVTAEAFGKAASIGKHGRKVSAMHFTADGRSLLIGGMGYLAQYAWDGARFAPTAACVTAVRDLTLLRDGAALLVNRGLQGLALLTRTHDALTTVEQWSGEPAVHQLAVNRDGTRAALLHQGSGRVTLIDLPPA